tara:strand:- start:966 stop:1490 length:525 start_codon:yes stop_codon:yes gene_type:complete
MKKIISILTLSLFLGTVQSQETAKKFEIKGITTAYTTNSSTKKIDKVAIKVYNQNTLIKTFYSNPKGKFEFNIPKNAYITLVFEKNNFVTKRVLFDTRSSNKEINKNVRPFDLEIVLLEHMDGIDYSELDFPITKIQYVKKMKDYYYATKYTSQMLKTQETILLKMEELVLSQK